MINVCYNILTGTLLVEGTTEVNIPEGKNEIKIDSIITRFSNGWWQGSTQVDDYLPNRFTISQGYSLLKVKNHKKILRIIEIYFKNFNIDYRIIVEPSRYTLKKGKKHDKN